MSALSVLVCDSSRGLELLVFDHRDYPEVGTEIPAGGVDTGESIEQAVLREVLEETGVDGVDPSPQPRYPAASSSAHQANPE